MFASEMEQTFADLYREADHTGRLSLGMFLVAFLIDELRNILAQHWTELAVARRTGTIPAGQILLAAFLVIPCWVGATGISVSLALALPHPALSGVFVLVALALVLLIVPTLVALAVSWLLARATLHIVGRVSARLVPAG
jgi:hypothetical protein